MSLVSDPMLYCCGKKKFCGEKVDNLAIYILHINHIIGPPPSLILLWMSSTVIKIMPGNMKRTMQGQLPRCTLEPKTVVQSELTFRHTLAFFVRFKLLLQLTLRLRVLPTPVALWDCNAQYICLFSKNPYFTTLMVLILLHFKALAFIFWAISNLRPNGMDGYNPSDLF